MKYFMFLQLILNNNKKFYNTVEKRDKMESHRSTSRNLQQEETERERKPSHRTNTWRWYWKEICCFQLLLPWQPQLTRPPTQWLACNESSVLTDTHRCTHMCMQRPTHRQWCKNARRPVLLSYQIGFQRTPVLPLTEVESGKKTPLFTFRGLFFKCCLLNEERSGL